MRALCAVVVACVVTAGAVGAAAASGGGAPSGEPDRPAGIARARAVPSLVAAVIHPVLHALTARPARTRARAPHPSLAAALASGGSLRRPGDAVIARLPAAADRGGELQVHTGSARGPPIG